MDKIGDSTGRLDERALAGIVGIPEVTPVLNRAGLVWVTAIAFSARRALAAAGADLRLIEAVEARDMALAQSLLRERVDVNTRQGDGATALHWAVFLDDGNAVDVLLKPRAGATSRTTLVRHRSFSLPESPGPGHREAPRSARESERLALVTTVRPS